MFPRREFTARQRDTSTASEISNRPVHTTREDQERAFSRLFRGSTANRKRRRRQWYQRSRYRTHPTRRSNGRRKTIRMRDREREREGGRFSSLLSLSPACRSLGSSGRIPRAPVTETETKRNGAERSGAEHRSPRHGGVVAPATTDDHDDDDEERPEEGGWSGGWLGSN